MVYCCLKMIGFDGEFQEMNLHCWLFKSKKKQRYLTQTQGTTAIEFAMVSPVFFLVFIGIFELGSIMYVQQTLDLALLQVSRFGRTGDTVSGQTVAAKASSLVNQYTFGLVTNPTLTVTPYASFAAIPKDGQGNIIYPNNVFRILVQQTR